MAISEKRSTKGSERAIVSGATSGIGRATAIRLARRGSVVAVMGRDKARATQVAREVEEAGGVPWVAQVDVTEYQSVQEAVTGFVSEFGGVETVVASAGIALSGTVTSTPLDDWHRIINTNLNGAFYLARATMDELVKTRGSFTVISSDAGVQGATGFAAYCSSKHALHGLIKCLALDHGPFGVRSNAVCPGFVDTPMAEQILKDATPAEIAYYKSNVPLGRFASPVEVAEVVAHLSSAAASYTNGLMYRLDGGSTSGYYVATPAT